MNNLTEMENRVLGVVKMCPDHTTSMIADQTPYGADRTREVYEPKDVRPVLRRLERMGLVCQIARQRGYARTPDLRWKAASVCTPEEKNNDR